jgi:hypothetical protein
MVDVIVIVVVMFSRLVSFWADAPTAPIATMATSIAEDIFAILMSVMT